MRNIKKFEDFLDRMQGLLDNAKEQGHLIVRVEDLENTFPELKESEDERIRKELINFLQLPHPQFVGKRNQEKWLAWLEEQDEQKSADKVEPKFKVGDTMRTIQEVSDGFIDGMPVVVSIDNEYYHCTNELIAIKDQDDYEYPPMNRKHNAWSEDDEYMLDETIKHLEELIRIDEVEHCGWNVQYYQRDIDWLKAIKLRMNND